MQRSPWFHSIPRDRASVAECRSAALGFDAESQAAVKRLNASGSSVMAVLSASIRSALASAALTTNSGRLCPARVAAFLSFILVSGASRISIRSCVFLAETDMPIISKSFYTAVFRKCHHDHWPLSCQRAEVACDRTPK